uniref:Peptidyl-prolyl cis-trans isomerase C n=1 Tax=Heterosigma akashiwo TaxID=2829 RepID=A0A6T5NIR0_HETAK
MKFSSSTALLFALATGAQSFTVSGLGGSQRITTQGQLISAAAVNTLTSSRPASSRLSTRLLTSMSGGSTEPYTCKASHILVKTEDEINLIFDGLQNAGWDFANVAKESSQCPSGKSGGDLGWFGKGMMVPEFEQAAFQGKVGDLVKVKTQFGWHVLRVDEQSFEKPKPEPLAVRARHILVQDEGEADLLMEQIQGGSDFEGLAQQQSSCPSKAQGGDLGWFGRNQMVKEFEEACYAAEVDDLMKVKTQFGWHVLQLTGRKAPPADLTVQDLAALLADPAAREAAQLVDVREPDELQREGSLAAQGFVNIPLSQSQDWAPKIARGELLDRTKRTVVLCKKGIRSTQMAQFLLTQAEFEDVASVAGGMDAYAQDIGLP